MLIDCPYYDAPAWCQRRGDGWLVHLRHPERNTWMAEHRRSIPTDSVRSAPFDLEQARIAWEDVEWAGRTRLGERTLYKHCVGELARYVLTKRGVKPERAWGPLGYQLLVAILEAADAGA